MNKKWLWSIIICLTLCVNTLLFSKENTYIGKVFKVCWAIGGGGGVNAQPIPPADTEPAMHYCLATKKNDHYWIQYYLQSKKIDLDKYIGKIVKVSGKSIKKPGCRTIIEISKIAVIKSTKQEKWRKKPGLYAVFDTSMGKIVCKLFEKKAPKTVKNFVGLAQGTKACIDMKTGKKVKKRFYDGLIFHRVIPNFMIQGGCPLGNGRGGPGYTFEDEFCSDLRFDRPGRLAMANRGPNTNGSQFFITHKATPWLNPRGNRGYTIFGQVVEGQDVVDKIGNVPRTKGNNKPLKDVIIKKVTILRIKL